MSKWLNTLLMFAFAFIHLVQGIMDDRIEHKTFHAVWFWGFVWQAYINQPKETKQ